MSDFNALVRLADKLYARFEAQGDPSDLSLCIVRYRSALTLAKSSTTLSGDAQGKLLSNLANALSIRFQRHGDIADLNDSVEFYLAAMKLRPPGHPGRAKTLSNFATTLLVRYRELGMQTDIELAIDYFNMALCILPPDGRLMPLMNYASALFSRFQHLGDLADLNSAIQQYQVVVNSSPTENRSTSHYNLANALFSRFKLQCDPKDLELSIEYSSIALRDMKESHPDCLLAHSCFAIALIRRFELFGDAGDLESAVKSLESALELQSAEDASRYTTFFDLADTLVVRYKLQSDISDLKFAIEHYRSALNFIPPDYKNKGLFLDNLGDALFLRFSRLRNLADLEEAIQKRFLALMTHSEDSPQRVVTLEALGICLDVRFEQVGDPEDLNTAIDLHNEALIKVSESHSRRAPILTRCANSLERRFRLYGGIVDLNRSISYCREALELLAVDDPDRAASYQVLASALLLRFEETGDEFDLDEAYISCNSSLNISNASGSTRAACKLLLARTLRARMLPWDVKDIQPILQHLRVAKDLCTLTHPMISDIYAELASTYYLLFLLEQSPSDLHEAFGLHELSMNIASGSWWPALHASLQWVKEADVHGHRSGVDVYRSVLRLLDRYILTVRSPELRQCLARRYCSGLASGGASFALRFQDPMEAIEALESGRSVLWSQLVRANTNLDELRRIGEYGASLADKFERVSLRLDRIYDPSKSSKDVKPLLKEKEAVVDQIRRIEGFKSFLKAIPFSDLEKAAIDGPVIVLNATQHACDALILLYRNPPIHIPLSQITLQDVLQMVARFRELVGDPVLGQDEKALEQLLADLWDTVVFPIIQRLLPHFPKGSRLWWCPTGAFTAIPLHAAAPYRNDESGLSQLYVSSYTPTLQALVRARLSPTPGTPRSPRNSILPNFLKSKRSKQSLTSRKAPTVVAIGHSASEETCPTLALLRNRIPPSMSFRRIEGEELNSEAVLAAFREPVWLHLACSASLDTRAPCRSGFVTRDGTVTLLDITKACPRVEFAYLSGQDRSARDDAGLDETMHFAASLQYAGVRSVVGTLWAVDEEAMRRVTAAFYEEIILKAKGSVYYTNTAQSLNEALAAVGNGVSLAQKIAFVHVGA